MTDLTRSLAAMGLLTGVSLAAIGTAGAATLEATSRIGEVTLYPDAALVKRQFTIDVPAGEHEILLPDLPASLDPASLRIEGSGTEKLVIGNVDFRARANTPDAGSPETQRKLKTLQAERDRLNDRIDAVEGRKAMIQRAAGGGESREAKPLDIEQWNKAWDLVGKGLQAANEELRTLRNDLDRIEAEIAAIENPSQRLPGPPRDVRRVATIAVEAASAGKATLTISYRVGNAGWRPVYDARLDTRGATPALEIIRRAMIRQNTGEDWSEAKIALSTLSVTRGTAAPELRGEKIAFYERPAPRPAPMSAGAPVVSGMMAEQEADAMAARERMAAQRQMKMAAESRPPVEERYASIEAGAYQTEFIVPGKVTVPSGGGEKSVRLGGDKPEAKLVIRAAPVLDPTAYLEASFKAGGEAPLLPGEVLLSRDGAFIGKGRLPLVAPGEETRLGFGSDDRVKITRVPVSRQAREPGLLGSTKTDEFQFRTSLRNLHAFPVALRIEDRVPVSEDQTIVVERMNEMTKPDLEAPDDRRGVVVWTPALKPGEEKAFITAYRIKWPATKETRLTPLPR